jgi:GNAT superfamily N-acetyltransferase
MTTVAEPGYTLSVEADEGDEFKRYLQGILNEYQETAYPLMEIPQSKRFMVRVTDESGRVVGGAQMWAYWGWADVSLVALEKDARGRGLGRRLMQAIEDQAREQGCYRMRVETFGNELGFYQRMGYRIVGQLEDYPEGYSYYWLHKDLR